MKTTCRYFRQFIKYTLVSLIFAGLNIPVAFAQQEDIYWTSKGQLIIRGQIDGEPIEIGSKELLVLLDYESGKVVMKQKISDLYTDNDMIREELNNVQEDYFRFEGKLGIDYINTTGHPPIDFQIEGTMYPRDKDVMGKGRLVHIVQGTANACLLSLTFQLDIDDVFQGLQLNGMDKKIYVTVVKSLLARENE